jgi:CRAL/TRIO domain
VFFLPERDYMGRLVIFYRFGVTDPKAPNLGIDVMTLMALVFELVCKDEENQIRGVVHVADAKGLCMSHFTVFSPQYSLKIGKNSEVSES